MTINITPRFPKNGIAPISHPNGEPRWRLCEMMAGISIMPLAININSKFQINGMNKITIENCSIGLRFIIFDFQ